MHIYGLEIELDKDIYEPSEDTFLTIDTAKELINISKDITILDMGTGTGIIGLYLSTLSNVKEVVLADRLDEALELAKKNYYLNKGLVKANLRFVKSNLFSNIKDKFDIIVFNTPYIPCNRLEIRKFGIIAYSWCGGNDGSRVAIRFLNKVNDYINKDSYIILTTSSIANQDKINSAIKRNNLKIIKENKIAYPSESIISKVITKV